MTTTVQTLDSLRSHIGRRTTSTDVATAGPANLLRVTFGRGEPELQIGDVLPPGWHVVYFPPGLRSDELRPDGTPRDTGLVPPVPLPRRMFAGERLRFVGPIR